MVTFMCQFGPWVFRYLVKHCFVCVCEGVLKDINIWINRLSNAELPSPVCMGLIRSLVGWLEQKRQTKGGQSAHLWAGFIFRYDICLLLPSEWDWNYIYHWLSSLLTIDLCWDLLASIIGWVNSLYIFILLVLFPWRILIQQPSLWRIRKIP